MPQLRVLLGLTNAADYSIVERADQILGGLYVSADWSALTPPITLAAFQAARDAFSEAIPLAKMGGQLETAEKNEKRATLIDLMRKLAAFVQENHDNDLSMLLASGFEAVNSNRAQQPLAKPDIREIRHDFSGQLRIRSSSVRNARVFEVQYALIGAGGTPGPWVSGGLHQNSGNIVVSDLTPGAEYALRIRAVGGSTGYSEWSDTQTHRSM